MDYENDIRPVKLKKYSNVPSNNLETSVSTRKPHKDNGSYDKNMKNSLKDNAVITNINNVSYDLPFNTITDTSVYQCTQDYNINADFYISQCDDHKPFFKTQEYTQPNNSQSMFNVSTESYCTLLCKSSESTPERIPGHHSINGVLGHNKQGEKYTDTYTVHPRYKYEQNKKQTQCPSQPSTSMYNDQFMFEAIQRNARLQNIVQRLVIERQKEKQTEMWNNFINKLKNKHSFDSNTHNSARMSLQQNENSTPEFINDCFTSYGVQPDQLQNLLHNLYRPLIDHLPTGNHSTCTYNSNHSYIPNQCNDQYYDRRRFCYPIASQGRSTMRKRSRQNSENQRYEPTSGYYHRNCVHKTRPTGSDANSSRKNVRSMNNRNTHTQAVQTDHKVLKDKEISARFVRPAPDCKDCNKTKCECADLKPMIETLTESSNESVFQPVVQPVVKPAVETVHELVKMTTCACSKQSKGTCYCDENELAKMNNKIIVQEKSEKSTKSICENNDKVKGKEKNQSCACDSHQTLHNIEHKLDALSESFNMFVLEMRAKGLSSSTNNDRNNFYEPHTLSTSISNTKLDGPRPTRCCCNSGECGRFNKMEQVSYSTMLTHTPKNFQLADVNSKTMLVKESCLTRLDEIIQEEIDKSENIKKDMEKLLHIKENTRTSTEVSFDIPMRDICTEVTKSLCNALSISKGVLAIEEVNTNIRCEDTVYRDMSNITIAVNTEPLGFLGLLRVSVETVKQFLSFVPSLNYYPRLPSPHHRPCSCHFVCNICGASFNQPSRLSDHIHRQHDLGRTRNCYVCRRMIDLQPCACKLFKCTYCGQRFMRAYCCELHQQACAKNLGIKHDISSDLALLK